MAVAAKQDVVALAARKLVTVTLAQNSVIAKITRNSVVTIAAIKKVLASSAKQLINAIVPKHKVIVVATIDYVVAFVPSQKIVPNSAIKRVSTRAAEEFIFSGRRRSFEDQVITLPTSNVVVAISRVDSVVAVSRDYNIMATAAGNHIITSKSNHTSRNVCIVYKQIVAECTAIANAIDLGRVESHFGRVGLSDNQFVGLSIDGKAHVVLKLSTFDIGVTSTNLQCGSSWVEKENAGQHSTLFQCPVSQFFSVFS